MTNTNATNFRKNIFEYLNQAVEYNDVINVTTKNGNAVVLSGLQQPFGDGLSDEPSGDSRRHPGRNEGAAGGLCSTG